MGNFSTFSSNIAQEKRQKGPRLLRLWYRMTSPPEPDESAPFEERELFRRGRTGSQISIVLFILFFITYPIAFSKADSLLIAILTINLFMLAFAMVLNRLKKVSAAGILVVLSFTAGPTASILTTPGGINTSALPTFNILILSLMCAVSFLPASWVFVVAAGNCLFTLYVLKFMPTTGELHEALKVGFASIVSPIVLSQGIVSTVAFFWVRGAIQALLRAERAEEVARLEHDMVLQGAEEVAEQKRRLDASIQSIMETHIRVANGDLDARIPLTQDNVLWQISGSLNNLLARLQRWRQDAAKLQQVQIALKEAQEEIARLKRLAS